VREESVILEALLNLYGKGLVVTKLIKVFMDAHQNISLRDIQTDWK